MSRGPGKIQRSIFALLERDGGLAYRVEDICRAVYGIEQVEKRHRVAVIRALQKMELPEGWVVEKAGSVLQEHLIAYRPDDPDSFLCYRVLPMPGERKSPINFDRWREDFSAQIADVKAADAAEEAERARWDALTALQQNDELLAKATERLSGLIELARLGVPVGADGLAAQKEIERLGALRAEMLNQTQETPA